MTQKRKLIVALTAAALTAATIVPAAAIAPVRAATPIANEAMSPVVQVQHRRDYRRDHRRDHRRGYYRHGNRYYYNGHRGYRHRRPGYRAYNGWWFPPAAFGVVVAPRVVRPAVPVRGLTRAHYDWCHARYRSYRAVDNSFQPYHGPRRACVSPYGP